MRARACVAGGALLITGDRCAPVRAKCGKRGRSPRHPAGGRGKGALKEGANFFLWQFQRASIKLPRCVRAPGFNLAAVHRKRSNEDLSHARRLRLLGARLAPFSRIFPKFSDVPLGSEPPNNRDVASRCPRIIGGFSDRNRLRNAASFDLDPRRSLRLPSESLRIGSLERENGSRRSAGACWTISKSRGRHRYASLAVARRESGKHWHARVVLFGNTRWAGRKSRVTKESTRNKGINGKNRRITERRERERERRGSRRNSRIRRINMTRVSHAGALLVGGRALFCRRSR